jgi:ribosomal subunit interface protein
MKINLKATGIDWTPSLKTFVEQKLKPLERLVEKFDKEGAVELHIEVARITAHHRKGEVYYAEANLRLPKRLVRAEGEAPDIRVAINRMRHTLQLEVEKYKDRADRKFPRR